MTKYLEYSLEYASQRSYLDDLYHIYPTIPNGLREINKSVWGEVERAFTARDDLMLVKNLLKLDLFPFKDSYVGYLRTDESALERNPRTVSRLASVIYDMGITEAYKNATTPKENNRQMGPCFKQWIAKGSLGLPLKPYSSFVWGKDDALLQASDAQMMDFAKRKLNYTRNKGLDFVARIRGKYVIGEAKFLTCEGGHQNAQFDDAISTLMTPNVNAIQIAILDGILYVPNGSKMYRRLMTDFSEKNIMSALVLREFLYEIY